MKLYTAKDMEHTALKMVEYCIANLGNKNANSRKKFKEILDTIDPIELPSDEEIDEVAEKVFGIIEIGGEPFAREIDIYTKGLKHGAKCVIEHIKQQDEK